MARNDKPYRVYRGGREKGRVPVATGKAQPVRKGSPAARGKATEKRRRRILPGRLTWKQVTALAVVGLLVLTIIWTVAGFLSFQSGVAAANKRFAKERGAKKELAKGSGLLFSHSTTILLLGTDSSRSADRQGDRHADSIMLVRTDPKHHKLFFLSIPRDLYVAIPGVGNAKINASYQAGGAALAIRTIREFTGIAINHVVIVDFGSFKSLIDAEGGITVNVPKPILSNRFDCPYPTESRCLRWKGWRFKKGTQHMSGTQALIYSRIRENRLDPAENDLTRGARQQAVAQAAAAKLTSFSTFLGLPFDGTSLMSPLTTDLSTAGLLELGWIKFRADTSHSLYCRLGGTISSIGGASVILPSEENRNVLSMWIGQSAPQPAATTFGPGCRIGKPIQ